MNNNKENKLNTYILGSLIGAVIGAFAAFLINKSSEYEGEDIKFTGKRISKVTMGTISLLWSLIDKSKD